MIGITIRNDMNTDRFRADSQIRQITTNDATGTLLIVAIHGHSKVSTTGCFAAR